MLTFLQWISFHQQDETNLVIIDWPLWNFFMCTFCLHICLYTTCMKCQQRPERVVWLPETGITDDCEVSHGWESKQGPLEEKPLLLAAKPSFQSYVILCIRILIVSICWEFLYLWFWCQVITSFTEWIL